MAKTFQLMFQLLIGRDFLRALLRSHPGSVGKWETVQMHLHHLHWKRMTLHIRHPWTEVDIETEVTISSLRSNMDHFPNIRDNESEENTFMS